MGWPWKNNKRFDFTEPQPEPATQRTTVRHYADLSDEELISEINETVEVFQREINIEDGAVTDYVSTRRLSYPEDKVLLDMLIGIIREKNVTTRDEFGDAVKAGLHKYAERLEEEAKEKHMDGQNPNTEQQQNAGTEQGAGAQPTKESLGSKFLKGLKKALPFISGLAVGAGGASAFFIVKGKKAGKAE